MDEKKDSMVEVAQKVEKQVLDYMNTMFKLHINIEDFTLWMNPLTNKAMTAGCTRYDRGFKPGESFINIYETDFGIFTVKTTPELKLDEWLFLPKEYKPDYVEVPVTKRELRWTK